MTLTEALLLTISLQLSLVFVSIALVAIQRKRHHRELVLWLDAMGDILGDLLRSINDTLKGK